MHCSMHSSAPTVRPTRSPLLLRQQGDCARAFSSPGSRCCRRARIHTTASTAQQSPPSAEAAVEQGLEAFARGDTSEALSLFRKGLNLKPSKDEARAALYNSACCLVKEKQWQAAADAVAEAINDYGLKYAIALKVRQGCHNFLSTAVEETGSM